MPYVTGSPLYAAADGLPIRYASLDGAELWRAGAAPVETIADFYGTGPNEVIYHISADWAGTGTQNVITTVANNGGAGATYLSTKRGSGINLYKTPGTNYFTATGISANYLQFAQPMDMIGKRLFMPIAKDMNIIGTLKFVGRSAAATLGERTQIQIDQQAQNFSIQRANSGGSLVGPGISSDFSNNSVFQMLEIEWDQNSVRLFKNGILEGEGSHDWPDYLVDRIFHGHSQPAFAGYCGDVLVMNSDGGAEANRRAGIIRAETLAKLGPAP